MKEHKLYHDRLTSSLDDLLRCRRYCEMMLKLPIGKPFSDERTIYEALFVAVIASYSRVFNTAKSIDTDYHEELSNRFGTFRSKIVSDFSTKHSKFHDRVLNKRDTAIAHSDAVSRNIKHFNDSALPVTRNPFIPYEHDDVLIFLEMINFVISFVGNEQSRVGEYAFNKNVFGQ